MGKDVLTATAWCNGSTSTCGTGYGFKVDKGDRDQFLKREWRTINLRFSDTDECCDVNIDKDSFWNDACRELISRSIGAWLIRNGLAPWQKGNPPKFFLKPLSEDTFEVAVG
ncbi:MAG: hypothetical protein PHE27_02920 [Alphaproteobacteria bacterium]|nr:hypothetical protein [Alphaproteobacteria bacterium]